MGKSAFPDAWDDDWENQADKTVQSPQNNEPIKVSKAERMAKHAELNKKLWESADQSGSFDFLETTRQEIPLKTEFKPAMKVLSRKPAPKVVSQNDPITGMARLQLEDDDDDDEENGARKAGQLSPKQMQLKAQRDREEKQRRYEEVRQRLFGSPDASSPERIPSPKLNSSSADARAGKGRGKGRGSRAHSSSAKQAADAVGLPAADTRRLYDPGYTVKPDSRYAQKRAVEGLESGQPVPALPPQVIRMPRGPDGNAKWLL
ncbi:MAG: hypothetical protein M1829_001782 [Trizodia sp. TS-e1964]|nr:MAG: hypothetical protein M1829_001782 [Trizodia sp. TS-e1964]